MRLSANRISRRGILLTAPLLLAQKRHSVLIVDGINNHDWQAATRGIQSILESAGRFRVDVSTTPPRGAPAIAWDDWKPVFKGYDAVISNFNGGHLSDGIRWPDRVEREFTTYLEQGGGFVSYHAANNAFLKWDDYNEMIGLGWRDPQFGPSVIVDDQERVVVVPAGQGLKPGHGPRHDFEMSVMDERHPITEGLPKHWIHPSEQLTHGQRAVANPKHGDALKELRILTYAWSKDSNEREPMDWIRRWNRGRIYVTMLGHTWLNEPNPNLLDPHFRTLFARGVEWAASGRVSARSQQQPLP